MREGLDPYEALKAITIHPAQITHLDDRIGSLKPGKDADIAVFSGHPLDWISRPMAVFVSGNRRA